MPKVLNNDQSSTSGSARTLIIILVVLVVGFGASTYYFYTQFTEIKENPQSVVQKQVEDLVKKVSKLIVLPEDEIPTVASVANVERLLDQPFFANAKNGDQVLIYTNARKAILYSPDDNKIVEVAPVNLGNNQASTPPTTNPEPELESEPEEEE